MTVGAGLEVTEATRRSLLNRIGADVELLQRHGIMDYSLLLGVREDDGDSVSSSSGESTSHVVCRVQGWIPPRHTPATFYLGIIDTLQPYNFSKQVERGVKIVRHLRVNVDVSAVDPVTYASRFLEFVSRSFVCRVCD